MAPRKKPASAMVGPGRRLGDGKVVAGSARRKEKPQDEAAYKPPVESSSSDSGADEELAEEDGDLDLDYIEVKQSNGSYMKIRNAEVGENTEKSLLEDKEMKQKWSRNRDRAGVRLAVIIIRHSYDHEQKDVVEYDFSDVSKGNADTISAMMVQCNNGSYLLKKSRAGHPTYDIMKPAALEALNSNGIQPCECVVCVARAKNAVGIKEAGTLRDGSRRGYYKYGPGKVLGGEDDNEDADEHEGEDADEGDDA